jgi:TP901 family phage tail tape measure protein
LAENDVTIGVKVVGDAPSQLREIRKETALLRAEQSKFKTNIAVNQGRIDAINKEIASLTRNTKAQREKREALNQEIVSINRSSAGYKGQITIREKNIKALREEALAIRGVQKNLEGLTSPALRYALYDVGSSIRNIALAFAAFPIATTGFAIKYERDFANVIRTNDIAGEDFKDLRNNLLSDLRDIAQATPISWEDITRISTLAGQLGIGTNATASFTDTVAKFAATTDLSVEAAATAFGRLDQLIDGVDGQFEKLGSSILAVGVDSVATESSIVGVAQQIASMGNLAGLSSADIIGLSGALASLGIQPELARGTITRLFSQIGKSVAEGGADLNEFGRLTGRTAEEFAAAWSSEPTEVIQDFFEGVNREGANAERTLREIGITSVRDIPAILRLAQSQDEVRRLIALSNEEFILGQKVNEQYSIISGTTAEQLRRLGQNVEALLASFGGLIGPVSILVGQFNAITEAVTDFINTPVGQGIGIVAATVSLLLAAFIGLAAAAATALAGVIALNFAVKELNIDLTGLTLKTIFSTKILDAFGLTSLKTSASVQFLGKSIGILGKALGILGAVLTIGGALYSSYQQRIEGISKTQDELFANQQKLSEALQKDLEVYLSTGRALKTFTVELEDNDAAARRSIATGIDYIKGQEGVEESTRRGSRAMEEQAQRADALSERFVVLGDSFAEYLRIQAAESAGFVTAFESENFRNIFSQEFGDFESFIDLAIGDPEDARARIQEIQRQMATAQLGGTTLIPDFESGSFSFPEGFIPNPEDQAAIDSINTTFEALFQSIEDGTFVIDQNAAATEFMSEGFEVLEYRADLAEGKINELMDSIFGEENAARAATQATQEFFAALQSGEGTTELTDENLQNLVESLAGNEFRSIQERVADLNFVLGILQANSLGSTGAALALKLAIVELGGAAGIEGINIDNFSIKIRDMIAGISAIPGLGAAAQAGIDGVGVASSGASGRVETLAEKFDDMVNSMFESINLGRDTEDAIFALGEAFGESGDQALYASDEMQSAISAILKQSESGEQGVANLAALFAQLAKTAGGESAPSLQILRQAISQVGAQFGLSEAQVQQFIATAGGGLANINVNNFNLGIQNAQKEVRTLLDYASDLENVFSRAFDIRFGRTFALDDIAESFQKLSEQVEDARFELEELQASQSDIGADRALKEYFLSIAEAYGDTLRAAQLRKEIAALDREQADNQRSLQQAQAVAGGDLTGQGAGQRQNRQALLGLVQDYQSYITALAESGATQEELKDATEEARQEFIQQAIELGFQESVVLEYAAAFDDVQTAISKVERNITVEANVNPALQALNELNASLNKNIEAARTLNSLMGGRLGGDGNNNGSGTQGSGTAALSSLGVNAGLAGTSGVSRGSTSPSSSGFYSSNRPLSSLVPGIAAGIAQGIGSIFSNIFNFSSGGFTGPGGKYDPAGIVHKGEYVIPKRYVNQSTGMPDPSFLARLQNGMRSFAAGGSVASSPGAANTGPMMVELSPYDRKLLADAGNVQLRLNGKIVAEATNRANLIDAQRGTN